MANQTAFRVEKDFLGSREIPKEALFGIHSVRAKDNFPNAMPFHLEWFRAVGLVKLAVYKTYEQFVLAIQAKQIADKLPFGLIAREVVAALQVAAQEVANGAHAEHFIVPAMQGGAGTSINLNVCEIISNRALELLGEERGRYDVIDPIEVANIYQSTNDVIPTALTMASMEQLEILEDRINLLRQRVEQTERLHRDSLRLGYTQLQAAVPTSFGKLFSTYNDALSRDWWRISKCFERIKVVNLGGSAIGTSIGVPRFFTMQVVPTLQKLTQQPITRSENLVDTTANLDSYVEVHGILKAHAVNLEKIASDLRLLGSDFHAVGELELPQQQVGSSIMPGKVNPVISEFVISVAHKVYANDMIISSLAGQGMLELNAYLPTIGHALLESLKLLIAANESLRDKLFGEIVINTAAAAKQLQFTPAITTALSPYIGYHKAAELAKLMQCEHCSVVEANEKLAFLPHDKLMELIQPANLLKSGFTLQDVLGLVAN